MSDSRSIRFALFGVPAVALAVAAFAPTTRPTACVDEVLVVYDAGVADAGAVESVVRVSAPDARATTRTDVRGADGTRLAAVVFELADARREDALLDRLRETPGVVHAGRNRHWQVRGAPKDDVLLDDEIYGLAVSSQPAIGQIGATGSGGDGVVVGVLDGGFDLGHEYIAPSIGAGAWDALDDDNDPEDFGNGVDDDADGHTDHMVGHGTFVSGLVHAVAPGATIVPIRVLDDEGYATDLSLWRGVTKALDASADVINMSMVIPDLPSSLASLLDSARQQGVVVVTAAGNDANGPYDDTDFAARSIVVGGVDGSDVVLTWSPSGTHVEVYAPSKTIVGPYGCTVPDSYGTWSGTSFGSAFVAGAAAVLKGAHPSLSVTDVEGLLQGETDPVTGDSSNGRVDIGAALDAANGQ